MVEKIISVFGSASPAVGSPDYEQARLVGQLLAEAGFAVATGGYVGTMAGVSQGAREAGGVVYGITCTQIEQYRPIGVNQWVTKEVKYETLRERLLHLVEENAGIIVLPGGIGTLTELSLAWGFIQVGEISPRPLLLLGDIWAETIGAFIHPDYMTRESVDLLDFAQTPAEAVALLTTKV